MKVRFLWAGTAAALLALAIACGSSPTSPSPSGNFQVLLKDSPFSDAKAVLVTFTDVSVHTSGGDWKPLSLGTGVTSWTCDLKQLQSAQNVLASATLQAGHYTGLRLTVSSATIYFSGTAPAPACAASISVGGTGSPIDIPTNQVFLNNQFDISTTGTVTMVLDFNGDQSIVQTGNGAYKMAPPVITVVSVSGQ